MSGLNTLGVERRYEDGSGVEWRVTLYDPTGNVEDVQLRLEHIENEITIEGPAAEDFARAILTVFRGAGFDL